MKIILEIDEKFDDEEIVIKCNSINTKIKAIENAIRSIDSKNSSFAFSKGAKEYYLSLDEILFFETDSICINAHTKDDVYKVTYKLYELEELLPMSFIRISKSTIVNTDQILSITKNITSSSVIDFKDTNKKVYASRLYYKSLVERINERRNNYGY